MDSPSKQNEDVKPSSSSSVEDTNAERVSNISLNENEASQACSQDNISQNEDAASSENEEPNDTDSLKYVIDDVKLKDDEITLSEEEKLLRQEEAKNLKQEGNENFKRDQFKEALELYTQALNLCPLSYPQDRSVLYSNRGAAFLKLDEKKLAIEDCSQALELDPKYMKALVRRAQLYEGTDKLDEALEDYKKIFELDPYNKEAEVACFRLPNEINERNEKLKTEMLGKLKDLGNMILKPFGLSTQNFNLQQDPQTGSYSVNFKQ